ncbi:FAD-binding domain-containing protein [Basidiobolus meristosporus CBS 931.73]|uniref:FAD-binding domain-containing protein n=1 Tax=Basidiobolus meristosporus CBS 931.73 TaxID=1314790 RepID=A0A1Y1XXV9_9FUNG|nr:FAD-binding domain-containing protein [Basidiobolus meristosporus CBS 931.73]|eukprot:ORX90581.1 FAD-binding domain-containing protein [Basidiobolus meristosporus CBS 931.73]
MRTIVLLTLLPALAYGGSIEDCFKKAGTPIVSQSSSEYSKVNFNFNKRFNFKPLLYVVAGSVKDVQNAVKCSVQNNRTISARSGGHSYEAYSQGGRNGDVIVDLSKLNDVKIDAKSSSAVIGAGSLLGPTYYKLFKNGNYGIPAGTCPQVGIGGHALGGGFGLFSRKHGMVSDNVLEINIVNAKGEALVANAKSNPDLYWALRGGGQGSYGIVTSFKVKLFKAPSKVTTFSYSWDFKDFTRVYQAFQDLAFSDPSDLLGPSLYINPGDGVIFQGAFQDTKSKLNAVIKSFLSAAPKPTGVSVKEGTLLDAVSEFSGISGGVEALAKVKFGGTPREYLKAHSAIVQKPINNQGVQALQAALAKAPAYGYFLFDMYGGAVGRVSPTATAFVHRKDTKMVAQMIIEPPKVSARDTKWLADAYKSVKPYFSSSAYQNYIDRDLNDWQSAYYGVNFKRLVQVKRKYDPSNVFHFAQSIPVKA